MSRDAFRFVHATSLRLDEPLSGTGMLSPDDRALAEDATFYAFEQIVETTIGAQADFLLLTGNCFHSRTQSLRARVALEKGFERLAAHQVAVYISPGSQDPASSWRTLIHLPPNVTLLSDEEQEPVAVMRDGRVLAAVYIVASPHSDETKWSASGPTVMQRHQAPFRIGIVPAGTPLAWKDGRPVAINNLGLSRAAVTLVETAIADQTEYLALGEGLPRTEYYPGGLAHDPGCSQSLDGTVSGSRGCTVVNVPVHGSVTMDSVAVAPVRWETISLVVEPSHNWDDLVERMALAVMERVADNDERLWILNWRISGQGPIFDSLPDRNSQHELWELVEAELEGETDVRRSHRLISVENYGPVDSNRSAPTGLLRQFLEILDGLDGKDFDHVRQLMHKHPAFERMDWRQAKDLLDRTGFTGVERQTRELAARWLD
ncbi:MAG: hypothetical protein KDA80_19105 [Planctomycetaceae bacterium]|nr:hypothetical protein [Planctomycetaceae bacterium]